MDERNILITGGAGLVGSHVVEHFCKKYPDYHITVLDNESNLYNKEFAKKIKEGEFKNVSYFLGDICNYERLEFIFTHKKIDSIIHLAEFQTEESTENSMKFIKTNIEGTVNLLNVATLFWKNDLYNKLFFHVSSNEVFSLDKEVKYETTTLFSASKAASDHFVYSYWFRFGLPTIVLNKSINTDVSVKTIDKLFHKGKIGRGYYTGDHNKTRII